MPKYKIRAHHAMCLQYFCGNGYSDAFVENMKYISAALNKNPIITVIDYGDDICSECPNYLMNNQCVDQNKVSVYDSKVLQYCSVESGITIHWKDFERAVHQNILSVNKRDMICKDCKWNNLCKKFYHEV
ncbi:DUF1284 domain-containing protein [Lachnotalea glycerini]|uniref:DUF1284 domain-containing protein n=1 Tax=Lachnotalea glycerini TaxID=1763509 RepID=A0A371JCE2_9FIRM|nr:DUF1284 domain-containing protein [Lachnotalea glycerini]RDY30405.1 DUF1284 domain-containing protein [Lachnotalea glycerini]